MDLVADLPELSTTPEWRASMKEARKRLGFTQGQLAAKVGVSQALISGIEKGTIGQSSAVHTICDVLHIPPPSLARSALERRWLELGRELEALSPEMLRGQIAAQEALVLALTPPPTTKRKAKP